MTPANIKNHLEYDYKERDKSDVSRIDSQDEVSSGLDGKIKPSTGDGVLKAQTDDGSHQFNSGVIVTRLNTGVAVSNSNYADNVTNPPPTTSTINPPSKSKKSVKSIVISVKKQSKA